MVSVRSGFVLYYTLKQHRIVGSSSLAGRIYTDRDLLHQHALSSMSSPSCWSNSKIIVTGDLNILLRDLSSPAAADFQAIADQFGLVQHVDGPTHRLGGWLDVIITRDDCALTDLQIFPPTISDHGLVLATIPYLLHAPSTFTRLIRGWRGLYRKFSRPHSWRCPWSLIRLHWLIYRWRMLSCATNHP